MCASLWNKEYIESSDKCLLNVTKCVGRSKKYKAVSAEIVDEVASANCRVFVP